METGNLRIIVYVQSLKVLTGEKLVEELYPIKPRSPLGYSISRDMVFKAKIKKTYNYVLPDLQKTLSEYAQRLCEQRGLELKVVDVSKETAWARLLIRLKGIKDFPVLETSRGNKLQAPFTQTELEEFISGSSFSQATTRRKGLVR
jgi:hypothetical protein